MWKAGGSIGSVLKGHEYNRSIWSHKVFHEAVERLRIDQFLSTSNQATRERYTTSFSILAESFSAAGFLTLANDPATADLVDSYNRHVKRQCESNPTYAFWSSYCVAVTLMLNFVRATTTSDWELHMTTIKKIIPWYFSYDQKNFRR